MLFSPRFLFIVLAFFAAVSVIVKVFFHPKQKWPYILAALFIFVGLVTFRAAEQSYQTDVQCNQTHQTTSRPPLTLTTSTDYLSLGDYDYDTGNCTQAVIDYSKAIALDPNSAQALNNRGYVYMRLHQYAAALPDLDQAIAIRPTYVNALMNRGDIYNYYYSIDRQKAMADYDRVIAQGKEAYKNTSVCGHRMLAKNNGWSLPMYFDFLFNRSSQPGC